MISPLHITPIKRTLKLSKEMRNQYQSNQLKSVESPTNFEIHNVNNLFMDFNIFQQTKFIPKGSRNSLKRPQTSVKKDKSYSNLLIEPNRKYNMQSRYFYSRNTSINAHSQNKQQSYCLNYQNNSQYKKKDVLFRNKMNLKPNKSPSSKSKKTINQINPYTHKEYLHFKPKKGSLFLDKNIEKIQKLKNIMKPCMISSIPLTERLHSKQENMRPLSCQKAKLRNKKQRKVKGLNEQQILMPWNFDVESDKFLNINQKEQFGIVDKHNLKINGITFKEKII